MKGNEELPNYYNVALPKDKPKDKWNVDERRAYILRQIIRSGDPNMINQTGLADRFGVTQQMISKDKKYIGMSINQHLDTDGLKMEFETAFRKLKMEAINHDDWELYRKVMVDFSKWLFGTGAIEKAPDKLEHSGIDGLVINFREVEDREELEDED